MDRLIPARYYLALLPLEAGRQELFQPAQPVKKKGTLMKKHLKKLPKFKNEDQEREFWDNHDSTGYFDMSKAMTGALVRSSYHADEMI